MTKKTFLVTGLLILLPLFFAACGGGGGSSQTEFNVTMNEFSFDPNSLTVPAGEQITLNLVNEGSLEHNFVIMEKGVEVEGSWSDAYQDDIYYENVNNPAGQESTASFSSPAEAGEYEILCTVPGHLEAGMRGTLTVSGP